MIKRYTDAWIQKLQIRNHVFNCLWKSIKLKDLLPYTQVVCPLNSSLSLVTLWFLTYKMATKTIIGAGRSELTYRKAVCYHSSIRHELLPEAVLNSSLISQWLPSYLVKDSYLVISMYAITSFVTAIVFSTLGFKAPHLQLPAFSDKTIHTCQVTVRSLSTHWCYTFECQCHKLGRTPIAGLRSLECPPSLPVLLHILH